MYSTPVAPLMRIRLCAMFTGTMLSLMAGVSLGFTQEPSTSGATTADSSASPTVDVTAVMRLWSDQVEPLLRTHCADCHGPAKQSGSLNLRSLTSLLAGGDRGVTINREHPDASLLLSVLRPDADPHMPPEGQLDEETVQVLTAWAEQVSAVDQQALLALAEQPAASTNQPPATSPYPPGMAPQLVIDFAVAARISQVPTAVKWAEQCSDVTFVRRIYLDLIGRIPTVAEREQFLASTDSQKRMVLIEELLASPEHAAYFAEIFDAVLMGRARPGEMKRRLKQGWIDYLTAVFAENRSWNEVSQEILLARPENESQRGSTWYLYERNNEHQKIAEAISRGVFGVRIECAQCHDHPLAEEIKQSHYWGLVAFYNRSTNIDTPQGPRIAESAIGGFSNFTNIKGESQPNRLVFLDVDPVDEARPAEGEKQEDRDELYATAEEGQPKVPHFSRRQAFVDVVADDHPLVATAMVNRVWGLLMGRGITHPVDALDSTHPPSHPQLLAWLANDYRSSGYDTRRLVRAIVCSDVYQRSSVSTDFVDPALFAVAQLKPLTAESLYRSMLVALGRELPRPEQSADIYAMFRNAFPDVLEENSLTNFQQSLLLTNGHDIHDWLTTEHSPVLAELIAVNDLDAITQQAFVRVLGRVPDAEELTHCAAYLVERSDQPRRGIDQLLWALLTSAEFRFNH